MEKDVFLEHIIRRVPTVQTRLIQVGILLAVPLVTGLTLFVEAIQIYAPIVLIIGCWGAYQLMIRQNVEFEYILTNGELDVDKITARRSRKRLLSVDCRGFEIVAPVTSAFEREYKSQSIARVVDASAAPGSEGRFFGIFNGKDGKRTLLYFNPDGRILEALRPLLARKLHLP